MTDLAQKARTIRSRMATPALPDNETRKCRTCERRQPIDQFTIFDTRGRRRSICRTCLQPTEAQLFHLHPERPRNGGKRTPPRDMTALPVPEVALETVTTWQTVPTMEKLRMRRRAGR